MFFSNIKNKLLISILILGMIAFVTIFYICLGKEQTTTILNKAKKISPQKAAQVLAPLHGEISFSTYAPVKLGNTRFRQNSLIKSIAFSPDSKKLAAIHNKIITIREVSSGKILQQLHGHSPKKLAFANSSTLAVAQNNGPMQVWDLPSGKVRYQMTGKFSYRYDFYISHNYSYLTIADPYYGTSVWKLSSGEQLVGLPQKKSHFALISSDMKTLFIAHNKVVLWNVEKNREKHSYALPVGTPLAVEMSTDSKTLFFLGKDIQNPLGVFPVFKSINALTGKVIHQIGLYEPWGPLQFMHLASNAKKLVVGKGKSALIVDTTLGKIAQIIQVHEREIHDASLAPAGLLATVGKSYTVPMRISLWDVKSKREINPPIGHRKAIHSAIFTSENTAATAGKDNLICLWNTKTGEKLAKAKFPSLQISPLTLSDDGKRLAFGTINGKIIYLNAKNGTKIKEWQGHGEGIKCIGFSVNGKWLASASGFPGRKNRGRSFKSDTSLALWNAKDGQIIYRINTMGPVISLAFSPNNKQLAYTTAYQSYLLDIEKKKQRKLPINCLSLCFSANGKYIAFSSKLLNKGFIQGIIRIWNIATKKKEREIRKLSKPPKEMAFSPDGKLFAAEHKSGEIQIWNVANWSRTFFVQGYGQNATTLSFSKDSKYLIAGAADGIAYIWDIQKNMVAFKNSRKKSIPEPTENELVQIFARKVIKSGDQQALTELIKRENAKKALAQLLPAMLNVSQNRRILISTAIKKIADQQISKRLITTLSKALKKENRDKRLCFDILMLMEKFPHKSAKPILAQLLANGHPWDQLGVVRVLAKLKDFSGVSVLIQNLVASRNSHYTTQVGLALEQIAYLNTPKLLLKAYQKIDKRSKANIFHAIELSTNPTYLPFLATQVELGHAPTTHIGNLLANIQRNKKKRKLLNEIIDKRDLPPILSLAKFAFLDEKLFPTQQKFNNQKSLMKLRGAVLRTDNGRYLEFRTSDLKIQFLPKKQEVVTSDGEKPAYSSFYTMGYIYKIEMGGFAIFRLALPMYQGNISFIFQHNGSNWKPIG